MSKHATHVVTNPGGGWSVRKSGATRASRNFETQREAITYARSSARHSHGELYIHRTDGRIRERNSYGPDPYPPRG